MKKILALFLFLSLVSALFAQTDLEEYFNLCLEFGAPLEIVQLYQPFRTYKGENNGSISYVIREDNSLLKDKPYSEYQIWYTIDKDLGLYQSSLIVRGDKPVLQSILTNYLRKFNALHGEPVYTNLDNGCLLIFWYNDNNLTVKARLMLDIVNSYKFVSITFCSPRADHSNLLRTLYNGNIDDDSILIPENAVPLSIDEESESPEMQDVPEAQDDADAMDAADVPKEADEELPADNAEDKDITGDDNGEDE